MIELILLICLFGFSVCAAWMDLVWLGAIGLAIFGAGSWLFGTGPDLAWMLDWKLFLPAVVLFGAIGAGWSLWKWHRHMRSDRIQKLLRDAKDTYDMEEHDLSFKLSDWFPLEAKVATHKQAIISWIVLWPFSMMVFFFEDFMVDVGRWIYDRLAGAYARISDSALPEDMR